MFQIYLVEIRILGSGCIKCNSLFTAAEQAVAELGTNASVAKVDDILKIMEYNILRTPALVVDGNVVSEGKSLSKNEIKDLLMQYKDNS